MLPLLNRVSTIWATIEKSLTYLAWVALLSLVFMVTIDVGGRFLLNRPLPASVEISQLLMPYVVFTCFAYALAVGGHTRVSIVVNRFPLKIRLWSDTISDAIGATFFALISYPGWIHFWDSYIINEFMLAAIFLPWWASKVIFPIGTGALSLRFLLRLNNDIQQLKSARIDQR